MTMLKSLDSLKHLMRRSSLVVWTIAGLGIAASSALAQPASSSRPAKSARSDAAAPLAAEVDTRTATVMPKVVGWRRDLHQHPELGNRETRTAGLVADHLRSLGIEVRTNVAHTGVVGVLKGGRPGKVVALRADMDAPARHRGSGPAVRVEGQGDLERAGGRRDARLRA